ncbi:hypothetical protein [uncultured Clostridium sp.]|uniref:hypothetical protein n=1 Tax=uncultured Clostridium sp. TaxID=59620 RepID=UPI0025E11007|nr:hypothetical protein [uncultured Clostridium sp.]
MKKKYLLLSLVFTAAAIASGCAGKTQAKAESGPNPYYDELNRLTFSDYEFHLGDTLRRIGEEYDDIKMTENELLPDRDDQEASYMTADGSRVTNYRHEAAIQAVAGNGEAITFLWASVENNTGAEAGSHELPITGYEAAEAAASVIRTPSAVKDFISAHIREKQWSGYDPEKLCFAETGSEEWAENQYSVTARLVVFEDHTFNRYLQYDLKGTDVFRSEEEIAKTKEMVKDVLDKMSDQQKAALEEKERFFADSLKLKAVTLGTPHSGKTREYADQVLAFVNAGRNRDYFLTKGDTTYTMLDTFENFSGSRKLLRVTDRGYTYQPETETLGGYGNGLTADTVWDTLGLTAEGSELLVLPAVTNFTDKTIDTAAGLVTHVTQYGGGYESVVLPDNAADAVNRFWLGGEDEIPDFLEYQTEHDKITVTYPVLSQNGSFCECRVDMTPLDYPAITIRYEVLFSLDTGEVTDANFKLLDEN